MGADIHQELIVIRSGQTPRMDEILHCALASVHHRILTAQEAMHTPLHEQRLLFAVGVDDAGISIDTLELLRSLRKNSQMLKGTTGGLLVDGTSEFYTKQTARSITLAANMAGCLFPGKPLVEGTGSLYNHHIRAMREACTPEQAYRNAAIELVQRILSFAPPRSPHPKLLILHASDNSNSNTVAMGNAVVSRLNHRFHLQKVCLRNGTIYDCRGCSYKACLHFSQTGSCFYGGPIAEEVFPAILECDGILLLCPNYNDAVSANITALINRMTGLLLQQPLYRKYLFSIVVSGYSGSDIVAQQVLGALCLNKTMILPPQFCLMQTANDPGSALQAPGVQNRIARFAAQIQKTFLPEE